MAIDIHAHYVPRQLLSRIEKSGREIGVTLQQSTTGEPSVEFQYGFATRPLFAKLVEEMMSRRASLDRQRVDRQ